MTKELKLIRKYQELLLKAKEIKKKKMEMKVIL